MRVHTYNPSIQEVRQEDHEFKDILNYIVKPLGERSQQRERENKRERIRERESHRESEREREREGRETANIPTVHSSVIPWICLKTGTQN